MFEELFIPEVYLPILYICLSIIVYVILKRIINRLINLKQTKLEKNSFNYKKTETFKILVQNIVKYIIILFLILAILTVYGVDVTSVLAGLGIVGVVVGLALQDFVKDIIAGISIIIENQYAIGDIISVDGFKGEVVFLGLKTTKIKSWTGEIKILANRNINSIINYSMNPNLAIIDISASYEDDTNKVEEVLKKILEELNATLPLLKGKMEYLGIESLSDSSVIYRIVAPVQYNNLEKCRRLLRKALKDAFDKENIKIPYPQIEVHNGK